MRMMNALYSTNNQLDLTVNWLKGRRTMYFTAEIGLKVWYTAHIWLFQDLLPLEGVANRSPGDMTDTAA